VALPRSLVFSSAQCSSMSCRHSVMTPMSYLQAQHTYKVRVWIIGHKVYSICCM
jgi:hypothetical protein